MKKLLVGCAVAVAVVALIASATAEPLYFIVKTADHTYNSAGNWYRPGPNNTFTAANKVPVPDDDAVIYAGNGNTCDATGVTAPLKSLTIRTGNSLTGGDFDLGALTFAPSGGPGTIGVFGTHFSIRSSGALNFNASGVGINDSQIILNGGSFATVASGAGPGFSGTTIFNEGSFVIQAGASVFFLSKANRFDNIGDIRGNGGTTHITSEFHNLTLNNSGTIRADSGTLFIDGEIIWAADDGTGSFYPFTKDAVVEFTGGFVVPPNKTYYFKGPGTVMTLGSVTVNGTLEVGVPASGPTGSHILADSAPAEPGNMVTVGNSTVGGGGVLNINKMSEFDVRGATVVGLGNGPGFLAFNTKEDGKTRISGPTNNGTDFESSGRAIWTIDGTVTTNVRQLQLTSTKITVGPVGTFNCEAPMEIGDDGSFESAMQVLGKMIARRGLGENPRPGIAIPFDLGPNGKFYLAGQGGPFQFAPYNALHSEDTFAGGLGRDESEILAPYIELLNGVFNVEPGVNFNDTRVAVSGNAVLNFNAVTAAINDFELDAGATLKGTGDLTILTKFLLNGGTVEGGDPLSTGLRVTLGPNCTSTVSTANDKIFNGGSFINNGVVNWANPGLLKFSNTVVLTNNGSFIFGADCTINSDPSSSFLNNGIFISTPPSGSSTSIGVPFSNTGGTVKINGSTTIFAAYAQSAGSTTFVDGVVNSPDTMNFTGGTLDGNGAINANVVNDGCTFDPNALPVMTNVKEGRASGAGATVAASTSPRRLTINGNYTQTSKGTFAVDIAGLATAGTDYSLLSVSGTAMLGGALRVRDVNGFKPSPTDTVVPLTAGSISGKFDSTNAQVNYGPTSLTVAALPLPAAQLLNISTRMKVLTGENVLIGGFIVTGADSKKVLIRALGPELPVAGQLPDPTLQLNKGQAVVATNDNWRETQEQEVKDTTVPPTDDVESATVQTLQPGNYTAKLSGANNSTGVGQVEVYDLSPASASELANISTRGFVDTGDNVMIGGLILGPAGTGAVEVLVRAIGPSLTSKGVANALPDPTLELHDVNGVLVVQNDDWKATQKAEIEATTVPPSDDRESAIVQTLAPGNYTAIVRGKNNSTGVGLVELYNLQ